MYCYRSLFACVDDSQAFALLVRLIAVSASLAVGTIDIVSVAKVFGGANVTDSDPEGRRVDSTPRAFRPDLPALAGHMRDTIPRGRERQ